MKSATKTVRSACGRTLLIVGNRKLTTEAEILQRVADEAGVPVDGPAYQRPIGAARGEQLAEAEKTRLMSDALRRGGVGGDLAVLSAGKESDGPSSGEAWDWRTDIPGDEGEAEQESKSAKARRHRAEFAEKAMRVLSPVSRIVYAKIAEILEGNAGVEARIGRRQNLLVVVNSPSSDWDARVNEVMRAWISVQAAARELPFEQNCYVCDESDRRYVDYASTIVRLVNSHVVLVTRPEKPIPAGLAPVVDATVWLTDIAFDDLRSAMRGRFPDDEIDALVEPSGFSLTMIGAEFLEGAILRAACASEVVGLASEMAGMAAVETPEKKADEKKPLSSRSFSPTEILRPTSPRLEDLHGYGAAAAWASDLVRDLADYRAGRLTWADVDAGALLVGPPGTGKTLFASALAASAGVPLVATSYSDWQGQGEAHGGTLIKALRQRFADASSHAPAILFIDELDAIPARGTAGRYDEWWRPVVTALLEALDGTTRREGLVVIAACNDDANLDRALVRSGRLDRRFHIDLPDEEALASIFAHHLPGGDPAAFATAATVLAGSTSGADVQKIAREARRVARRAQREVEASDLLSIAMPPDTLSPRDRRLAAVHEAGHAVAAMVGGETVCSLSIVTGNGQHGGVLMSPRAHMMRASELEASVLKMLAGRAAEEVILGEVSGGASSDLANSSNLVRRMLGEFGLGARLAVCDVPVAEVETRLQALYARALRLVTEHRAAVEALADLAIERRVLGRAALEEFAREHRFGGGR